MVVFGAEARYHQLNSHADQKFNSICQLSGDRLTVVCTENNEAYLYRHKEATSTCIVDEISHKYSLVSGCMKGSVYIGLSTRMNQILERFPLFMKSIYRIELYDIDVVTK